MGDTLTKLEKLGYQLPAPSPAAGNYLPYRMAGDLLFVSGQICMRSGEMTHTGPVGMDRSIDEAKEGAKVCLLNALAIIQSAIGDLDRVDEVVILNGFVQAGSGFAESPAVINGASDLLVELFGDRGRHARTAVTVSGLPANSTVELQLTVRVSGSTSQH